MQRKKLPIGIQTLREIRQDDCYYVDKTPLALQLVQQGKYFFLSRPRRFGKSLFLDTLKELFEGNAALFRGLYAERHWNWSLKYPVLRFSFGGGVLGSKEELEANLHEQLTRYETQLGTAARFVHARGRFTDLIHYLCTTTGQRVVVLVDEYDKPILDRIEDPQRAQQIREVLKDFYSVIKDSDAYIRFAFLTGVSKFSKVSLFSGLNNLQDITLDERYSAICGYTDEDVDSVFAPELPGLDREEIRRWYNGYNWLGTSVYNPFDLLLLFDKRKFHPYWFETGTPTFLLKLLGQQRQFIPELGQIVAGERLLSTFDVEHIAIEALLWQTGYLTIDQTQHLFGEYRYRLRYPNREVYQSLHDSLIIAWSGAEPNGATTLGNKYRLGDLLLARDVAGMRAVFHAFFASIPHDWYRNNPITQYEGFYASVFYSYFAALGLDIVVEDTTNHGRIDMAVRFEGHTYLFEFKVVELAPEGKALQQLQTKNYADKYRADGPVHLIGVEFSRDSRNIVGFDTQTIQG